MMIDNVGIGQPNASGLTLSIVSCFTEISNLIGGTDELPVQRRSINYESGRRTPGLIELAN